MASSSSAKSQTADSAAAVTTECPVCMEQYSAEEGTTTYPFVLGCSHGLCETCMKRLKLSSNNNNVKCPLCNTVSATAPIKNRDLAELLQILSGVSLVRHSKSNAVVACQGKKCKALKQPNNAIVYCCECRCCLCESCSNTIHGLVDHEVVPVCERPREQSARTCDVHKEQKNFYCETCSQPI